MTTTAKQRDIQRVRAQLASPVVVRALGAAQVAQIRARLVPIEAAFLSAKLPATAALGNADASAFEFKDYKVNPDPAASTAAQTVDSNAKAMMFGKMSAADIGGVRMSLDPATQMGTGTGVADVAQFLESLHTDPKVANKANDLERDFMNIYKDSTRVPLTDLRSGERWYAIAEVTRQIGNGVSGAQIRLEQLIQRGSTP